MLQEWRLGAALPESGSQTASCASPRPVRLTCQNDGTGVKQDPGQARRVWGRVRSARLGEGADGWGFPACASAANGYWPAALWIQAWHDSATAAASRSVRPSHAGGVLRSTGSGRGKAQTLTPPLFVAKNGRRDPSDTLGIGDRVDRDDLALDNGEAHDGEWPATDRDDCTGRPVHDSGSDDRARMARAWLATAAAPRITAEAAGRQAP